MVHMKPIEYQHSDVFTDIDEEVNSAGFITISPKLLHGTHVANIPLKLVKTNRASGSGNEMTTKILKDEVRDLEGVI
ncbi:hypothetical protein LIER_41848 [Lithospermum erythrorhizon]|uniref:Uncharacterized protein n=1 Tax=Lithospermum erythrorhizon TaxID=34254 RepID=A0AAV3RGH7_LITER